MLDINRLNRDRFFMVNASLLRLFVVSILFLTKPILTAYTQESEDVTVYTEVRKLTFPTGYSVIERNGNSQKTVKTFGVGAQAQVAAHFDQNGIRHYISDWSYGRMKENGEKPNLIIATGSGEPFESRDNAPTGFNGRITMQTVIPESPRPAITYSSEKSSSGPTNNTNASVDLPKSTTADSRASPASGENANGDRDPITFNAQWQMQSGNSIYTISKFTNTGDRPIVAFRCNLLFLDDFDEVESEERWELVSSVPHKGGSRIWQPGQSIIFERHFFPGRNETQEMVTFGKLDSGSNSKSSEKNLDSIRVRNKIELELTNVAFEGSAEKVATRPTFPGNSSNTAQAECRALEVELRKVYDALLEKNDNDDAFSDVLQLAQTSWEKYVENHLFSVFPVIQEDDPAEVYGPEYPEQRAAERAVLLKQRIEVLKAMTR